MDDRTWPERATWPSRHLHAKRPSAAMLREAATILQEQYRISERRAYALLVERAAEAGTSVRQVATILVADSAGPDASMR